MTAPLFLTLGDTLQLHQHQIEVYGGSPGVRDQALLESALAQPCAEFGDQFLHQDLFEMAAAYLFHLVQNHPFIDGNKRIGAACAHAFLFINGVKLPKECEDQFEDIVMKTAQGKCEKDEIAAFFKAQIY
jgi:death-on-curing protein